MKGAMILNYLVSVLKSLKCYRYDQKAMASFQAALEAFQQSCATERSASDEEQEAKEALRKERECEVAGGLTLKVKEEVA